MNYDIEEFREAMDLYCLYRTCSDCPMNGAYEQKLCNDYIHPEYIPAATEILIRDGYLQPLVNINEHDITAVFE